MDARVSRAFSLYQSAQRLAAIISRESTQVMYTFEIFVEDKVHGGMATGTDSVVCDAIVPLNALTKNSVTLRKSVSQQRALQSGEPTTLKCTVTVQLHDRPSNLLYRFASSGVTFNAHETYASLSPAYTFTVLDNLCQPGREGATNPEWIVDVTATKRNPLVLETIEFTHDPSEHPTLMRLLSDEASKAFITTAFYALKQTPDTSAGYYVGSGVLLESSPIKRARTDDDDDDDDAGADDQPSSKRSD